MMSYMAEGIVGTGSFGVVFQVLSSFTSNFIQLNATLTHWVAISYSDLFLLQAKCLETGEAVAIKKVFQDKRYKNRELQTMRLLDHPNIVQLKHYFFSTTEKNELYLNLVLEYVSDTLFRVLKYYNRINQYMPLLYIKLYTYQVNIFPTL